MTDYKYVRAEDRKEYQRFCLHHLPQYGRNQPHEVWHYTTAEGLLAVLGSGHIWATQVACLNDRLEQKYFGSLVHERIKVLLAQSTLNPNFAIMVRIAETGLSQADFAAAGHFVACFSEVKDDLGQWRGYGGGECGYAIGFRTEALKEILKRERPHAFFVPMNYEDEKHKFLADDVVRIAQVYFQAGLARGFPVEPWAREFLEAFGTDLDIFASLIKNPKFESEREWRIITRLQDGEHQKLEFRQKKTLLARHLPINLCIDVGEERRLPITGVVIGPGPAQRVTQVSVGDALIKFGYKNVPVEVSNVPYRVP